MLIFLLAAIESYYAWHPSPNSSTATTKTGATSAFGTGVTLDVYVYDANTNAAIPGASIYLNGNFQGTSDSNGYVLIVTMYPPAIQTYNVTAAGYQYMSGTWKVDSNATGLGQYIVVRLTRSLGERISESQLLTVYQPLITTNVTHSVNYYIALLRSNPSYQYSQLALEIEMLPDVTNATAVAQIAFLALNSSNRDVTLGFEKMLAYGTPAFNQFGYMFPNWNVELWNLYKLACDVTFGKNDGIPLAIAMDDGIFTVMGDSSVQNQVRTDDAAMLRLSREIMVWQSQHHMVLLAQLPFEALLYWAWRGSTTAFASEDGGPFRLVDFVSTKMSLSAYLWDTVSPHTLEDMRTDVDALGWAPASATVGDIVQNVETYFYFPRYNHWDYHYDDGTTISVYGVTVTSGAVLNVNWQYYERFRKGLSAFGYCVAETAFVEAWLKSVGIPTDAIRRHPVNGAYLGHIHTIYYDPVAEVWKGYYQQVELAIDNHPTDMQWFQVLRLPYDYVLNSNNWSQLNLHELQSMFVQNGITSSQMQQWMS